MNSEPLLRRVARCRIAGSGGRVALPIALMLAAPLIAAGSSDKASPGAASDSLAPAAATPLDDVRTLSDKTRTFVLEAAPACAIGGVGDAAGAGHALEVGADALSLSIEFELGTARLAPGAARQLDRLVATLKDPALANARFLVTGHTDATGGDAVNIPLSCNRAKAVRDYLLAKGLAQDRLEATGLGSRRPLAGTSPTDAANRRVEIRRLIPPKESS